MVLNEFMSVSDDVAEMATEILRLIAYGFQDKDWVNVLYFQLDEPILCKEMVFGQHELSGLKIGKIISEVHVKLYGYNNKKTDYDTFNDHLSELSSKLGYDLVKFCYTPLDRKINIFSPFPLHSNNFLEDLHIILMSTIRHEVEHAYQAHKAGGMNISKAYTMSTNKTDWDTDKDTSIPLLKYYIKNCYYAFDFYEIDARIQEIWYEIDNGTGILEDSESYQFMKKACEGYEWVIRMLYPKEDFLVSFYERERNMFPQLVKSELGLNAPSQWLNYCKRGIKRYRGELRRLMGRYAHVNNKYGSGSFKQYANGEIPQGDIFPKKLPIWRRVFNRLRKR